MENVCLLFYKESMNSNKIFDQKNTELLKQNWLTGNLVKGVESNSPTQSKNVDDKRDHDTFSVKCDKLFAKERELLSYKRLYTNACKCQETWNGNLYIESGISSVCIH